MNAGDKEEIVVGPKSSANVHATMDDFTPLLVTLVEWLRAEKAQPQVGKALQRYCSWPLLVRRRHSALATTAPAMHDPCPPPCVLSGAHRPPLHDRSTS